MQSRSRRYATVFDGRVSDSLHEIVAEASAKKIRFVKSFSTEDVLYADPLAMRKVMLNLLSNAVKFTPSGGCVTIKFENLSKQSFLTVTDTGIGVEPELLDSIFWHCAELETVSQQQKLS